MNKQEVYQFLDENGIKYEVNEHKAVHNMEDLSEIELLYPNLDAKNIFVRDDKKANFYLITVQRDKKVDLKQFQKIYGTRRLSFSSENDLYEVIGLKPGGVSPLGILNDQVKKVIFYLDEEFIKEPGIIGVHPNENTAMVWLKVDDLVKLIKSHGNEVNIVKFE